jgi:hypothetical protein
LAVGEPGFDVVQAPDFALAEGGQGWWEVGALGDLEDALPGDVAQHRSDFVGAYEAGV